MRDGGGYPPRRHRGHLEPGRRRPRDRQDRRHRIRKRRPRRPRQPRINHQPTQQLREPRPHHIDPAGEPAQPPPHRLPWTTQALRDPACSHTGRLRRQRRPHHLHRIRPPQQHLSRQQHMRRPAAGTPGPARTQPPPARSRTRRRRAYPHRRSLAPPQPGQYSSPATSCRSTSAWSTPTVNTRCLRAPSLRPSRTWPKDRGRAAAYLDLLTVTASTKKGNPPELPSTEPHRQ